jgi:hypothetical protein
MLDLNPAPYFMDKSMMIINSKLETEAIEYFGSRIQECQAIIATDIDAPEIRLFMQEYPRASVIKRSLGDRPYYLLLAPVTSSRVGYP